MLKPNQSPIRRYVSGVSRGPPTTVTPIIFIGDDDRKLGGQEKETENRSKLI